MSQPAPDENELVVGRIGRPHGIRGELTVEPRTDEPERRFAEGSRLGTRRGREPGAPLTVAGTRWHSGRLLVRFAEVADRNAAEEARGLLLTVPLDPDLRPEDPEEFYDHQLIGLRARSTAGDPIGEVAQVVHGAAQDLLVIRPAAPGTAEVLVPFVAALVPVVDLDAGELVVEDLPGLLDLPGSPGEGR